jgi:hypothetical protein
VAREAGRVGAGGASVAVGLVNPDVAAAVDELRERGVLADAQAGLFARVARDQLVSVHNEVHALLYLGVVVTVAGVGWLVKDQITRLGPLTIVSALALAASGCFIWVHRRAPGFT